MYHLSRQHRTIITVMIKHIHIRNQVHHIRQQKIQINNIMEIPTQCLAKQYHKQLTMNIVSEYYYYYYYLFVFANVQ